MSDDFFSIAQIAAMAGESGLVLRGGFGIDISDSIPLPDSGDEHGLLLLFGQVGSDLWRYFAQSPEYNDGAADPLDRWSHRIGSSLAGKLGGRALFPFEGPPWYPFGRWAQRAERIRPSPLGILLHPQSGLWHAYRFAIVLPASAERLLELSRMHRASTRHACDQCTDKPCLTACPVHAFADGNYDVAACAAYLQQNEHAACHRLGCLARAACPEGRAASYEPEHRQFHMRQFYAGLGKSSGS